MRLLLLTCLGFVALGKPTWASHSDPPKIQVKECVLLGTTSESAVKVFIKPLMRVGVPADDQIYQVRIVIDSRATLERTTLFVGDAADGLVLKTQLKADLKGDYYHYEFALRTGYLQDSCIYITFKNGSGNVTKNLDLGTASLPKLSEQGVRE